MEKNVAFLISFCAVFTVNLAARCNLEDSHDLVNCPDPLSANVTLLDKEVYVKGAFLTTHEEIVYFPETGLNQHLIHCILVEDLSHNNEGNCVEIEEGGLYSYNVRIKLTSQVGKDINSLVQIYGSTVDLTEWE